MTKMNKVFTSGLNTILLDKGFKFEPYEHGCVAINNRASGCYLKDNLEVIMHEDSIEIYDYSHGITPRHHLYFDPYKFISDLKDKELNIF